jgi:multicomponent K+:H+ antiporter subunit D
MMGSWIIAPVVLPAMVAGLMVTLMRGDLLLQRVASVAAILALNAIAVALLWAATTHPPEAYHLGNWPAPFGIVLVLDKLSALMVSLLSALALAVVLYAIGSRWDERGAHFHPLLQFLLMGIAGAFLTGDAFNLFVFFEVLLIASYGLMVHAGGGTRTRAGIQYVAFNLVGSALFLIALSLIYAITGTLNMADLAVKLPSLPEGDFALIRVAAVMLILVFAIKGALVPLQFWLPGTYANAPGVTAAMFAVMTKIGAYATLRVGTLIFPPSLPATTDLLQTLLLPAGLVTLAVGAIGVLGATTLPRLAAFGGIASMGTAFIAISAFTPQTTVAALYYVLHSTLATAALFLVADLITRRRAHARLTEATAPIAQSGLIASLYLAVAIAMAGMPPLSGFIGKLLILDAFRDEAPLIWTAILGSSFLMILGFARAGSTLFWKPYGETDTANHASQTPAASASPPPGGEGPGEGGPPLETMNPPEPLAFTGTFALVAGLAFLTIFAGPVTDWLTTLAQALDQPAGYIEANMLGQDP